MKILLFGNCQMSIYKRALNKILDYKPTVEYWVSYENLNNFKEVKNSIESCDVLVIQPISNYEDFKLDNLKQHLKSTCNIITVPYIRFKGFFNITKSIPITKLSSYAYNFPNVKNEQEINDYITNKRDIKHIIEYEFVKSCNKLKKIELNSDIKFYNFFLKKYKTIPLFKDQWHPTSLFNNYLQFEFLKICKKKFGLGFKHNFISKPIREAGHFQPITNETAEILGLEYNLDSYYQVSRFDFLNKILNYEKHGKETINTYEDFCKLMCSSI